MKIESKAEFYRLWTAGALGFRLRTWTNPADAYDSGVSPVGFRDLVPGSRHFVIVERDDLLRTALEWRLLGRRFMICEAAPDEKATIQGEVMGVGCSRRGLIGHVVNGKRMRDSLRDGDLKPQSPAACLWLLNTFMDSSSRNDLDELQDLYPTAVVEFTCYGDHDFGRGRNTIFWEVRDY